MVLEFESGGELYEEIVQKTRLPPEVINSKNLINLIIISLY